MTRRVAINLIAFAVLGVVMVWWALQNVVTFSFLARPYHVVADFESSPGLHPGFEVDYLGVPVGKVGSVHLEPNHVRVRLDIDRDQRLPAAMTAAAARKSAVGEPYVALTPRAGAAGGPSIKPGAVIPVQDTTVPPAYGDLFAAVNKSLSAINPEDVKVLVHELYNGWNGRSDSVRQIIEGGDQITTDYASNSELLDGLTDSLTKITHVVAENRGSLADGIDNLAQVVHALAQVRGQLAQLRDQGPGLLDQVNTLLDNTGPDLGCAITSVSDALPVLATSKHLSDLSRTLSQAPALVSTLNNVVRKVDGQYVLNVLFILTVKTQATLEYKHPLTQPTVSAVPSCPDGRIPGQAAQISYPGKNPNSITPQQYRPTATGVRNVSDGSPGGVPMWLVYVPPVIALLVLMRYLVRAVPVLARRRRGR